MKKILSLLLLCVLGLFAATEEINVGTGGEKGNYFGMAKDIFKAEYCGTVANGNVITTEGSLANLDGLVNKLYSVAIVQADALLAQANARPLDINQNTIKIISTLHAETVHLLIPKGYKPEKSLLDKFSFGTDKPLDLTDLKG